jgi:hypothetical protein
MLRIMIELALNSAGYLQKKNSLKPLGSAQIRFETVKFLVLFIFIGRWLSGEVRISWCRVNHTFLDIWGCNVGAVRVNWRLALHWSCLRSFSLSLWQNFFPNAKYLVLGILYLTSPVPYSPFNWKHVHGEAEQGVVWPLIGYWRLRSHPTKSSQGAGTPQKACRVQATTAHPTTISMKVIFLCLITNCLIPDTCLPPFTMPHSLLKWKHERGEVRQRVVWLLIGY